MKVVKFFFAVVLAVLFAFTLDSCKKCKNDQPSARIINNGTQKADVQVKTSGGNTININNVAPGTSSPYASYAPGQVTFTITVASNNYVKAVDVANCYDYDISIDGNNNISVAAIDRNK